MFEGLENRNLLTTFAEAGGPYSVAEGSAVVLSGAGSSDAQQTTASLTYAWDLDGDTIYGETGGAAARGNEVGISPTFSAVGLDGPSSVTVGLRVTDNSGAFSFDTATIDITNVAPTITSLTANVVVANVVSEYSGVQGQGNWQYGYYATPGASGSFTPMSYNPGNPFGNGPVWTGADAILWSNGGHPGNTVWAARRWVSEVTGAITITGQLAKSNSGGDGINGRIFVNGAQVYAQTIAANDLTGVNYSVTVNVVAGQTVDFLIDDNGAPANDSTTFTANITIANAVETNVVTLTGTFTDPDLSDTHVVVIDWNSGGNVGGPGEGTTTISTAGSNPAGTTLSFSGGVWIFTATHVYLDDNPTATGVDPYQIGVSVTDSSAASDDATTSILVSNVAPKITSVGVNMPDANSLSEYSGVQGQNNWQYGYYATGGNTSTFTPMTYNPGNPFGNGPIWFGGGGYLWADGGHPGNGTEWAARRWISEIAGEVTISGLLAKMDAPGNGIVGRIYVDGVQVFSQNIAGTDLTGVNYSITTAVQVGSTVDFLIDNNGSPSFDSTRFTANIAATGIAENNTVTLIGTFTDPGTLDSHTIIIDWNSGGNAGGPGEGTTTITTAGPNPSGTTLSYSGGVWTFTATHLYLDDNPTGTGIDPYQISVSITDDDTGGDVKTTSLTVSNVLPSFDAGADEALLPASAGVFGRGPISFTDPGSLDVWSGTVNYGDGSGNQPLVIDQLAKTFSLGHTYATENIFTVTVSLKDDDGISFVDTFQVTVTLPPPVAEAGGPYTVAEGSTVVLSGAGSSDSQQPNVSLTYEWDLDGDYIYGEIGSGAGRGDEVGINPIFSAAGLDGLSSVTVGLRVTNALNKVSTDTATIEITNVAPTFTSLPITTATQGAAYSYQATATDPGGAIDPQTWSLLMGPVGMSISPTGLVTWTASAGASSVTIRVEDGDGGITDQTWTIQVAGTTVTLDGSNNLVVTDVAVGGKADTLTIKSNTAAGRYEISDSSAILTTSIAGATGDYSDTIFVPFASVSGGQIMVNTLDGNDALAIDLSPGSFSKALTYNGGNPTGAPGDSLILTGATVASVTHTFVNAADGSVAITDNSLITYTGLDPITDNLSATDRVFMFTGGSESIALTDAAGANLTIVSTLGESVTFANPLGSLTIDAGSGDDTVTISSVDAAFNAALTIDGGADTDVVNINTNLALGSTTSTGNLVVTAEAINLNATSIRTDQDTTNNDAGSITLTGSVVLVGSGTLTLDSEGTTTSDGVQLIAGSVNGGKGLSISSGSAGAIVTGAVGNVTALTSVDIRGTIELRGGAVTTTGAQFYRNGLLLDAVGNMTTLTSVGGGEIRLGQATSEFVRSVADGEDGLTINTSGQTWIDARVGENSQRLASITTDAAGTARISPITVLTTGNQTFNDPVTMFQSNNFHSSAGSITFSNSIDSGGVSRNLTVTAASGDVSFAGAVGSTLAMNNFNVNAVLGVATISNAVTLATGGSVTVVAETISLNTANSDIAVSGTGAVTMTASRNLVAVADSTITVVNGNLTLDANQQAIPTAGNFHGLHISGQLTTTGAGNILVRGRSGTGATSNDDGVLLAGSGATIASTATGVSAGDITIIGVSGASGAEADAEGVSILGLVQSVDGNILIQGTGANATGVSNAGVLIANFLPAGSGMRGVQSTGTGNVTIAGTALAGNGAGVILSGGNAAGNSVAVLSAGGNVAITGAATSGPEISFVNTAPTVGGTTGTVELIGDRINLAAGTVTGNTVTIRQRTAGVQINLGGADVLGVTLGLTDAELDRVTAGTLNIGDSNTGTITVSAAITRSAATDLTLTTAATTGVSPAASGTDLNLVTTGNLVIASGSDLKINIAGLTADTQYNRLNVVGTANITGVDLVLSGAFVSASGNVFTIVSATSVTGTFNGLAENAIVNFNGRSLIVNYTATTVTLTDVTNTPPIAEAGGPYSVPEGGSVVLDGSDSSDAQQSTASLNYAWDLDGDSIYGETGVGVALRGDEVGINPTFSAVGLDGPSVFTVGLRVTDNSGAFSFDTATINITNVAPTITTISGPQVIVEGQLVTVSGTFSDPALGVVTETFTGTALWSDGATTAVTIVGGSFSTTRTFLDDNPTATASDPFTVTITINDDDLGSDSEVASVTVNNVAPVLATLTNSSPDCGCDGASMGDDAVTIAATFTDVGTLDTHTVSINWGDGHTTSGTVVESGGNGTVAGSHVYATGGIFTITVTLLDDDGGTSVATTTTTVSGVGLVNGVLYVIGTCGEDRVEISMGSDGGSDCGWDQGHGNNQMPLIKVNASFGGSDCGCDGGSDGHSDGGHDHRWGSDGGRDHHGSDGGSDCGSDGGRDRRHGSDGGSDGHSDGGSDCGSDGGHDRRHSVVRFNAADVTSIHIVLCGCDDSVNISEHVNIDAYIDGGDGNDSLNSGGGNDTIVDLSGNNTVHAGKGNDTVNTGAGNDKIWGDSGNDVIDAGEGRNEVRAGSGNDTVTVGDGHNRIWTDGGDDTITAGNGCNEILAGTGSNQITVGHGSNYITTSGSTAANVIVAGNGNNEIRTGSGNDTITVGHGANDIRADGGHDTITTGNGHNTIDAGSGNDTVTTGSGNDCIDAGSGNDVVFAGAGHDYINGGDGNDILVGGDGDDTIFGGKGRDLLFAGLGKDTLDGDQDDDLLIGGYTSHDTDRAALDRLMAEWGSSNNYATRVANIRNGSGATSGFKLTGATAGVNRTVFDDNVKDTLKGDDGQDWFFADQDGTGGDDDKITDKKSNETVDAI